MDAKTVELWNAAHPRLRLDPARIAELPIELGQLRDAAEAARPRVTFDADPAAFRALLMAFAQGGAK